MRADVVVLLEPTIDDDLRLSVLANHSALSTSAERAVEALVVAVLPR